MNKTKIEEALRILCDDVMYNQAMEEANGLYDSLGRVIRLLRDSIKEE